MQTQRQSRRFCYQLSQSRIRQIKSQIQKELPARTRFNVYQIQFFLKTQGFHLEETEIIKITNRIFNKTEDICSLDEVVGIYARLHIDEEVEADFRTIFEFFAGSEEFVTTQELKAGLSRLGEAVKDEDINRIFLELDLNYNGFIHFETFLEAMLRE